MSGCQQEVESGLEIAGHSLPNNVTRVESKIDLRLSSHTGTRIVTEAPPQETQAIQRVAMYARASSQEHRPN